jgi:hypothetical protein
LQVAPGFVANLVLLGANPLENISATRQVPGVMSRGRWFDHAWLQETLAGVRKRGM